MIRWPRTDGKHKFGSASSSLASRLRAPLSRYTQSHLHKAAWQPTDRPAVHSSTGRHIISNTSINASSTGTSNTSINASSTGASDFCASGLATSSSAPAICPSIVKCPTAGRAQTRPVQNDPGSLLEMGAIAQHYGSVDVEMGKHGNSSGQATALSADAPLQDIYNLAAIVEGRGEETYATATLDKHGNPLGSDFDLARDGAFNDCRLLIGCFDQNSSLLRDIRVMVVPELQKKGWVAQIVSTVEDFTNLLNEKQFQVAWIISSPRFVGDPVAFIREVRKFHSAGRGLMIWGENCPYYAEANIILHDMFGFKLRGDTPGGNELVRAKNPEVSGRFCSHLICTGILRLYEGATICFPDHAPHGSGWSVYGTSTDKKPVLLAKEAQHADCEGSIMTGRVVVDCGYTKLLRPWWAMAGTARYVSNTCAWLAWRENFP